MKFSIGTIQPFQPARIGNSLLAVAFASAIATNAVAASFTPGYLVVTRLDNGINGLVNSGNSVHLDEFTTATGQTTPVTSLRSDLGARRLGDEHDANRR